MSHVPRPCFTGAAVGWRFWRRKKTVTRWPSHWHPEPDSLGRGLQGYGNGWPQYERILTIGVATSVRKPTPAALPTRCPPGGNSQETALNFGDAQNWISCRTFDCGCNCRPESSNNAATRNSLAHSWLTLQIHQPSIPPPARQEAGSSTLPVFSQGQRFEGVSDGGRSGAWALTGLVPGLAAAVAVGVSGGQRALLGLMAGLATVKAPPTVVAPRVARSWSGSLALHRLHPLLPLGFGSPTRLADAATGRLLLALLALGGLASLGRRSSLTALTGRLPTSPPARRTG